MQMTPLRIAVGAPRTEHSVNLPKNTVRITMRALSAFPIRVSLVSGEVADGSGGFVVSDDEDTELLAATMGPLYFASDQPSALMTLNAYHLGAEANPILAGGAFDESFDDSFDIGF